jgi:hypothetical protein
MKSFASLLLVAVSLSGQNASGPAGHWEGTVHLREKQVRVSLNLAQNSDGKWTGNVDFPDVGGTPTALTSVIVKGATVSLQSMEALCGLDGTMAADGSAINGEFLSATLRTVPVPMELKRVGGPRFPEGVKSTQISAEVQGVWEGSLKIVRTWEGGDPPEGTTLRLRIKLAAGANGATGSAAGIFPTQNNELPVTAIVQDGDSVRFEVKASGSAFKAHLKGDELTGEWSQFNSAPVSLTLKRTSR